MQNNSEYDEDDEELDRSEENFETPIDEVIEELEEESDELQTMAAEVLTWKDLAQRKAAELDNFRKRSARDREQMIAYANQSLLEELLPIIDHFEMGMKAAEAESNSMIYIGMDMVRKQLDGFLADHGVKVVEAEGKEFDPNLHDAVGQEASETVPEGHVLYVQRRGYLLKDRLLRPASVIVSIGDSVVGEDKE